MRKDVETVQPPSALVIVPSVRETRTPAVCFDCWHFACFKKPDIENFYLTIVKYINISQLAVIKYHNMNLLKRHLCTQ